MYSLHWILKSGSVTRAWGGLWWKREKTLSRYRISCRAHPTRGNPPDHKKIVCYEILDRATDMGRAFGTT
jgi:hypothetical protein